MQRPSYPKETPDQWPPIAGDHSEWGGACNQSINIGCSLGERYNLMRHTHTPPPLCDFLLLSAFSLSSSRNLFFLSFSCRLSFCWALSSTSSLHFSVTQCPPLVSPPIHSHPPSTSLKFQGDGTHKSKECSWAGVEDGGEDDDEHRAEALGGGFEGQADWWRKDRMDSGERLSHSIYRTEISSTQIIRWSCFSIDNCMTSCLMNYKFLWRWGSGSWHKNPDFPYFLFVTFRGVAYCSGE